MSRSWFSGAIDLHIHSSPSIFPRLLDDHQVVQQARQASMRAVVLKAHEGSTVSRAQMAQAHIREDSDVNGSEGGSRKFDSAALSVFGGVVLNRFVGGINPFAVEIALAMGAAIVWMPTLHARNHVDYYGQPGFDEQPTGYRSREVAPLTVTEENGRLKPEVLEVLEVMTQFPTAILNNGHLGAKETTMLFREAKRRGIDRLMVAHPELPLSGHSLAFQLQMARMGAVIERCYLPHLPNWGGFPIERTVQEIGWIGARSCVLSTDFGQVDSPPPAVGLESFGRQLIERGISEEDVARMIKRNPAELLGLD